MDKRDLPKGRIGKLHWRVPSPEEDDSKVRDATKEDLAELARILRESAYGKNQTVH